MFDVTMISEPKYDPDQYKMVQPSDSPNWYQESLVKTKDALKNVQIAFSKSLQGRSPAIYEFFERFMLTLMMSAASLLKSRERARSEGSRAGMDGS